MKMTNEHRWVWEILVPVEMNGFEYDGIQFQIACGQGTSYIAWVE